MAAIFSIRSRRIPLARFLYVGGKSETTDSHTSWAEIGWHVRPAQPRSRETTTRLSADAAMPAGVFSVYAS